MLQLIDTIAKVDSMNLSGTFVDVKVYEANNDFVQYLLQPNTFVAVLALFVSIYAIYYHRKTYKLSKEHNVLLAKPILEARFESNSLEGKILVELSNYGLGPAQIDKISFNFNGKYESPEISVLIKRLYENKVIDVPFGTVRSIVTLIKPPSWLAEKSTPIPLYSTTVPIEEEDSVEQFIQIIGSITINVSYSDIYGNKQEPIKDKLDLT